MFTFFQSQPQDRRETNTPQQAMPAREMATPTPIADPIVTVPMPPPQFNPAFTQQPTQQPMSMPVDPQVDPMDLPPGKHTIVQHHMMENCCNGRKRTHQGHEPHPVEFPNVGSPFGPTPTPLPSNINAEG